MKEEGIGWMFVELVGTSFCCCVFLRVKADDEKEGRGRSGISTHNIYIYIYAYNYVRIYVCFMC